MWKATADEPWVLKFSTCPLQKISDGSRGRARCLSQPSPEHRQDGRPSVLISQNAPHVVSVLIFVNPAKMVDNPKLAFLAPMAGGQRFGDCSSADLGDWGVGANPCGVSSPRWTESEGCVVEEDPQNGWQSCFFFFTFPVLQRWGTCPQGASGWQLGLPVCRFWARLSICKWIRWSLAFFLYLG